MPVVYAFSCFLYSSVILKLPSIFLMFSSSVSVKGLDVRDSDGDRGEEVLLVVFLCI